MTELLGTPKSKYNDTPRNRTAPTPCEINAVLSAGALESMIFVKKSATPKPAIADRANDDGNG